MDLDGTICTQMPSGQYADAKPIPEVIKKVNELWAAGCDIIIFTARGMDSLKGDVNQIEHRWRGVTEKWLLDNRVCYNKLMFGKPLGDYYVDDKGMRPDEFSSGNF